MDLNAFEAAVREVAFLAVLITGCAFLIGIAGAAVVWAMKSLLWAFGMSKAFLSFLRKQRRQPK